MKKTIELVFHINFLEQLFYKLVEYTYNVIIILIQDIFHKNLIFYHYQTLHC